MMPFTYSFRGSPAAYDSVAAHLLLITSIIDCWERYLPCGQALKCSCSSAAPPIRCSRRNGYGRDRKKETPAGYGRHGWTCLHEQQKIMLLIIAQGLLSGLPQRPNTAASRMKMGKALSLTKESGTTMGTAAVLIHEAKKAIYAFPYAIVSSSELQPNPINSSLNLPPLPSMVLLFPPLLTYMEHPLNSKKHRLIPQMDGRNDNAITYVAPFERSYASHTQLIIAQLSQPRAHHCRSLP